MCGFPHNAVSSDKKDQARVVFYYNTRYKGRALSDELLQGPDRVNPLPGYHGSFSGSGYSNNRRR